MDFKNSSIFLGIVIAYCLQANAATPNPKESEMKHYKELKTMDEYKAAIGSSKPQIIKFYTESCGACKSMKTVFSNVARKEHNFADFSAINIEDKAFQDLIKEHSLVAVPTTLFIKFGQVKKTDKGSMSEEDLDNQVKSFAKS